jgi:hypothetical protein
MATVETSVQLDGLPGLAAEAVVGRVDPLQLFLRAPAVTIFSAISRMDSGVAASASAMSAAFAAALAGRRSSR